MAFKHPKRPFSAAERIKLLTAALIFLTAGLGLAIAVIELVKTLNS